MSDNLKLNLIISAIIAIICIIILFFAYKGFYPFNNGLGKDFHYFIYDEFHIAFNHSNYEYDDKQYWCYESSEAQRHFQYDKKILAYDEAINKIQIVINNAYANKYNNQNQIKYDIDSIETTYKYINLYGNEQLKRQQEILDRKIKYNQKLDESIKELEDLKKDVQDKKYEEIRQMLNRYCIEVLSN